MFPKFRNPQAREPADAPRRRYARRLFEDTVRALYRHERSAIIGHGAAAGLTLLFLDGVLSLGCSIFLGASVGACALLRGILLRRFQRLQRTPSALDQRLHSLVLFGCAGSWSLAFVSALPELDAAYRSFLMMVLAGLTAGSLVTLSSRLRSFALFSCTLLLPPMIALLAGDGPLDRQIGVMSLLYLGFCTSGALKAARTFQDVLIKRYQNQDMMNDLAGAKHELETAWRKSEAANQAKQRFLANVSHEVRTPLNGILGIADLLLDGELDEEQRNLGMIIKRCGSNLLLLINDLLDLSKIEAGKMRIEKVGFELEPLLRDVEALHAVNAATRGVAVRLVAEPGLPARVTGDPTRLRQVLNNLVGNAVKFTDEGEVRVRAGLGVMGGAARLMFEISDDGVGIPADRIEAIFESFVQADDSTTRKHGGTGLGLAITRQLVELMGGSIHVESTFGVGSTFRFDVPIAAEDLRPAAAPAPAPAVAETPRPGEGLRVLLAEDGEVNALVLQKTLHHLGFEVARVRDGQQAVDAFAATRPDLVILDIQMPRLDGLAAARALRQLPGGAEVPILGLSAHCDEEERARCRGAGMDEALVKPCTEARLRQALSQLLRPCRAGARPPR